MRYGGKQIYVVYFSGFPASGTSNDRGKSPPEQRLEAGNLDFFLLMSLGPESHEFNFCVASRRVNVESSAGG